MRRRRAGAGAGREGRRLAAGRAVRAGRSRARRRKGVVERRGRRRGARCRRARRGASRARARRSLAERPRRAAPAGRARLVLPLAHRLAARAARPIHLAHCALLALISRLDRLALQRRCARLHVRQRAPQHLERAPPLALALPRLALALAVPRRPDFVMRYAHARARPRLRPPPARRQGTHGRRRRAPAVCGDLGEERRARRRRLRGRRGGGRREGLGARGARRGGRCGRERRRECRCAGLARARRTQRSRGEEGRGSGCGCCVGLAARGWRVRWRVPRDVREGGGGAGP